MLEEILGQKLRTKELEEQIKKIEEDNGLPALRKQLKASQNTLEAMLAEAVLHDVFEEGTLRIVTAGRNLRYIKVPEFREAFPEIAEQFISIPVTAVEAAMIQKYEEEGFPKKEAKQMVSEKLEAYIEIRPSEKWDILDLVGEQGGSTSNP